METPLQIAFRHMDPSPALESRVRTLAARLEKFSAQILHCHVVIEKPRHYQHQGELFDVTIDITVPGSQIAIRRASPAHPSHEDAYIALHDAFRAARRRLQDYRQARRRDIKTRSEIPHQSVHTPRRRAY